MWLGSHHNGTEGMRRRSSSGSRQSGAFRYGLASSHEKPRCTAPRRRTPTASNRSSAPIHSGRSGLTGFLTSTGTSTPLSACASSATMKGFAVVRAPIHTTLTPAPNAASTWAGVATSVAAGRPISRAASTSHLSPSFPPPSNDPGRLRGFHTPARNAQMFAAASERAASSICAFDSALHGPAISAN